MLPALVGQFIILVQGTSLISAFSVIELTGAGQNPLQPLRQSAGNL
jgi:ABC-type amino acid transport system permease subunit